jgi:hypothetical protein
MFEVRILAAIAWIAIPALAAADTTHEISWRTIGASVHTSVDLDGKGSPASFVLADGDGTFGPASIQGMTEPAEMPIEKCPAGTAMEFHVIGGTMVRTFRDTLDQVFVQTISGLACISEDGSVTSESEGRIVGGTGRFAGATGRVTTTTLPQTVTFPVWKGEFNNIPSRFGSETGRPLRDGRKHSLCFWDGMWRLPLLATLVVPLLLGRFPLRVQIGVLRISSDRAAQVPDNAVDVFPRWDQRWRTTSAG